VPGPDASPLETLVERAVRQAVSARRADLERLLARRVDAELAALARELLDARLAGAAVNGNGAAPHVRRTDLEPLTGSKRSAADHDQELELGDREPVGAELGAPPPAGELCSRCGERPRLPQRSVCASCKARQDLGRRRRARARERAPAAAASDEDGPRPADAGE
jgi:hypothetical protein